MALDGFTRAQVRGPALRAVSISGLVLAFLGGSAGCSQEGRTVQNPVVVQGIAVDVSKRTVTVAVDTSATPDTVTSVTMTMDLAFKVQIAVANRCEAEKSALELKSEGPLSSPTYVITPVARYQADDACNIGAAGDTVLTLTVQSVTVVNGGYHTFAVRGAIPFEIGFTADTSLAERRDSLTRYQVRVEDKDTGAALSGAIVRVERADTSELIGETTTDATGHATVAETPIIACTSVLAPPLSTPYNLKVSYSGRSTILRMKTQPARCGVPERAVVRI